MIKFTELRVQKERLIIVAEVREIEDYYDNVYIDEILIDTQDTFVTTGPSANVIYSTTVEGNQKKVTLSLSVNDFTDNNIDINKTMFFVYAKAKGIPHPCPCGFDQETSIGVTFSMCPIYNATMQYVKEVEYTCDIPENFINMYLRFKAIQYSIESGHFTQAIKYYNKFFKGIGVLNFKSCGCHGRFAI